METKESWKQAGYACEPLPRELQEDPAALAEAIKTLCREKQAVILAHYYTASEVQDIADFVGDSLALARQAAQTDARVIVMCGVHFMGETCKILCPEKTVLVPDLNASCSLADSCPAEAFEAFVRENPGRTVVSYVNTSAAVKALTDVVVTSSNARAVVESLPEGEKILFGPDRNLGNYLRALTGRDMIVWDGACHVHERFSTEAIVRLRAENPGAEVLVHPECRASVVALADKVGSTAALLEHARSSAAGVFIVATESGILHQMRRSCPDKWFIPVPPEAPETLGCACNECAYMRLITLEKLYNALKAGWPEVDVPEALARRARQPIERMLAQQK